MGKRGEDKSLDKGSCEQQDEYEQGIRLLEREQDTIWSMENKANQYLDELAWNWKENQRLYTRLLENRQFLLETGQIRDNMIDEEKNRLNTEMRGLQEENQKENQKEKFEREDKVWD
ncbi:MAG: hypothetical protein RR678_10610 [Lachnospiraceae bacterium]